VWNNKFKVKADYEWQAFSSLNPLRKWWKQELLKKVLTLADGYGDAAVLVIGCGSSPLITHFSDAVGIDMDPGKIEFMKRKAPRQKFLVMDARDLKFEDNRFDLIFCLEVIEHIRGCDKVMSEIRRVLRSRGKVIISTPDNGKILWRVIQPFYNRLAPYGLDHISLFTFDELLALGGRYGLELETKEYVASCDLVVRFRQTVGV
jgi:ubiquinone/menaquinone biosynthesis C-methylase UbiE